MNRRIAVIGGVASGPAAAAQARRTDPEATVVLFEQGADISYGACEMPYYVAGRIEPAEKLVVYTPEEFEASRGVEVRTRHRVVGLEPRRNHLHVEDLATGVVRQERFDAVVLATGARARMPGLDGEAAPNVFALRTLADARGLHGFLDAHAPQHAVILGGGYVGVEVAEALQARRWRVTILEPRGLVLASYASHDGCAHVQAHLREQGVTVRADRATGFRLDARGHVAAIDTEQGERIGCALVVVAMGITPRTDLAEKAGVKLGATGAIAVEDTMRTNVPGVWACGDCVEVRRVVDDAAIYAPLAPTAFRTARVAGENAARQGRGGPARFPGVCPASAVRVLGIEIAAVGLRLDEARAAGFDAFACAVTHRSRVAIYPGGKPLFVVYVVERGSGRLLGGELVGEEGAALRANVLVPLVRERWSVRDVRDLDLVYNPPIAPSMDPLLVTAHRAATLLDAPTGLGRR